MITGRNMHNEKRKGEWAAVSNLLPCGKKLRAVKRIYFERL
jgi:hypothetical protein